MYVTQANACTTLPNGFIPASAAQVSAKRAKVANMETAIQNAQAALDSVSTRRDMGPVVTSPARFFAPSLLSNWPAPGPGGGGGGCKPSVAAPVRTGNSTATLPTSPPLTTRPLQPAVGRPTTGNPCLDVQIGYALQSQLTKAMLWKCTQNGYFKTPLQPTVAGVLALANQNALAALPDSDVPPFDPSMTAGMGDLTGGPGSFALWASVGLLGATLWLATEYAKGHR